MGSFGSFVTFINNLQKISQIHEESNNFKTRIQNNFKTLSVSSRSPDSKEIKEINKHLSTEINEWLPISGSPKICEKVFKTSSRDHDNTKNHQGLVSCRICRERFKKKDLLKHKTEVHKEIGEIWKCELCNKLNFSKWDLMMHINYRHLNKENFDPLKVCTPQCPSVVSNSKKCDKGCETPRNENEPVNSKHSREKKDEQYVCCGKLFKNINDFHQHKKSLYHKGLITCRLCHGQFEKEALFKHQTKVHKLGKWKCELCVKVYTTKRNLRVHLNFEHANQKKKVFKCGLCVSTFYRRDSYQRHCKSHEQQAKTMEKENAKLILVKESPIGKQSAGPWECCGLVFPHPSNYKNHLKSYAHQGLVTCGACREHFRKEDILNHKFEVHSFKDGKYICKVCDKSYFSNGALSKHKNSMHRS